MKIPRKDAAKTLHRLLESAIVVFAEKGYRDATIAEISKRAQTNVAAVNYHFGNKETLYIEAWKYSFSESIKAHPPDGGVSKDAPPEERLRGCVEALLHGISDENNRHFLLVQKELANPTGLLDEVMKEEIRPLHKKMENLVRQLQGPRVSKKQILFCTISILSQCMNPMVILNGRKENRKSKMDLLTIDDIETYARHVVNFSLAGIRAIQDEADKKPTGGKKQCTARIS